MTNAEAWAAYGSYTRELSEQGRKLAFAAVGVAWLFRTPSGSLPNLLLACLFLTVAFFLFDLLQYAVAALAVRRWVRSEEIRIYRKTKSLDGETYQKPTSVDFWPTRMALGKHLCLLGALGLLVVFVGRKLVIGVP